MYPTSSRSHPSPWQLALIEESISRTLPFTSHLLISVLISFIIGPCQSAAPPNPPSAPTTLSPSSLPSGPVDEKPLKIIFYSPAPIGQDIHEQRIDIYNNFFENIHKVCPFTDELESQLRPSPSQPVTSSQVLTEVISLKPHFPLSLHHSPHLSETLPSLRPWVPPTSWSGSNGPLMALAFMIASSACYKSTTWDSLSHSPSRYSLLFHLLLPLSSPLQMSDPDGVARNKANDDWLNLLKEFTRVRSPHP